MALLVFENAVKEMRQWR